MLQISTLGKFKQLFDRYSEKYGLFSKATEYCAYTCLCSLIEQFKHSHCIENSNINSEIEWYIEFLRSYYRESKFAVVNPEKFINIDSQEINGIIHKSYKREPFMKKYNETVKEANSLNLIRQLDKDSILMLDNRQHYLFIINQDYQIYYYTKPFSVKDSIFNTNRIQLGSGRVAHPVIVGAPDKYIVYSGEFCPIYSEELLIAIIFNNKSGHFMFDSRSTMIAKSSFNSILPIENVEVISIDVNYKN